MPTPTSLTERLFKAINTGDESLLRSVCAPTYSGFDASREKAQMGRIDLLEDLQRLTVAFPDGIVTPVHRMAKGDSVHVVWLLKGTHNGTFMGIPATRRVVEICGFSHLDFEHGHLVRGMHLWDMAGLLRSLRLLPDLPQHTNSTGLASGMLRAFRTTNHGTIPQPTP